MSNNANSDHIIYWTKDYFLTWSDFKGTPEPKLPYSAMSKVGFQCKYDYEPIKTQTRTKLKINSLQIRATFRPMLSWVISERVSESGSAILLKHEQGHFDLAEEFARRINLSLKTEFRNKTFSIKDESMDGIERLMFEIQERVALDSLKKLDDSQQQYEQETKNGRISEKQKLYDERFDRLRR